MPAMMDWIKHALQDHPAIALFLALAAGYWVGRLRIKSFKLGAVVGCLLTGVAVGQLSIVVPSVLGRTFFLLFLFSVGHKTGPQFVPMIGINAGPSFVHGIRSTGLVLLLSTIVVCAVPYLVTILVG
jgi:putative transport protein